MPKKKIIIKKEKIVEFLVKNPIAPIAEMARYFNTSPQTMHRRLDEHGIEYSGNQGSKGYRGKRTSGLEFLDRLQNGKKKVGGFHYIRLRLIEDGTKEHRCEVCGITEWNGKPTPLDLHHIDGNKYNNVFENIQIICPNCHAQTESYCGKNTGKNYKEKYLSKFESIGVVRESIREKPCTICGMLTKNFSYCSNSCKGIGLRSVEHPSKEQLEKDLEETNFTQTGKKYGVSDNAVRKWAKQYELIE